ncbi:Amino acid transporter [Macleaya cordata]|uniref:Amino acid transporter n=1 Tax=Macleaya cordata TaxID=56857 RepID=A0A200QXZ7_MACCD|nr:Amino acid transporter [Macleaya cordata]
MEMERVLEIGRTKDDIEDDGHQREGTVWTATAHCITAVIGSGILALSWSVAQLGWVVGPIALLVFAAITYYASTLLADCYRSPHPVTGSRNRTYMDAVRSYLGPKDVLMCALVQYANLWGAMISYTITASISMMSVSRSNCYHKHGRSARCATSGNLFMVMFGASEIILSQLPNMEKIAWLSVVSATMSLAYSVISLCLCLGKWIGYHGDVQGTLFGTMGSHQDGVPPAIKTWNAFQALGNIAFAYTFAEVMIEIEQDTVKAPPSENVTMKKANLYGIGTTTIFYLSIGCVGYAAFGNTAPGNILTGFYEPFWLVELAHICIVIHLVGAYQVFAQPIFAVIEKKIVSKWPEATFIHNVYTVRVPFSKGGCLSFNLSKLILRTILIVFTTLVSMLLPFFNAIMGLLGASSFWALTVYVPMSMSIVQRKIQRGTSRWIMLQTLSVFCFFISLVAGIGSVAGIIDSLRGAKPFHIQY